MKVGEPASYLLGACGGWGDAGEKKGAEDLGVVVVSITVIVIICTRD
jgi:hypothetical protein